MTQLRHTGTLPTSTRAIISLAEIPSSTEPPTPVLLKTYLRSDVARHNLTPLVHAERTALVRLSHCHSGLVPRLMSASVSPTSLTLTMHRAPGIPALRLPRPLPPSRAAAIIKNLLAALHQVHQVDVVHADVTLRNVIVNPANADAVCLVDFGSCFVRYHPYRDSSFTTSAHVLAPELLSGAQPDPTADVWALGIFTWALLFGGPGPFGASNASDAAVLDKLDAFARGNFNVHSAFQAAARRLEPNLASEQQLHVAHNFIAICLACNPKDRFRRPLPDNHGTFPTWADVIDYDRIKAHPFLQPLCD